LELKEKSSSCLDADGRGEAAATCGLTLENIEIMERTSRTFLHALDTFQGGLPALSGDRC
jgi:hypothetical protein